VVEYLNAVSRNLSGKVWKPQPGQFGSGSRFETWTSGCKAGVSTGRL